MLLTCLISCRGPGGDTSIRIDDSKNVYQLTAYFPLEKTASVKRYINSWTSEGDLFSPDNDHVDVTAELKDHTRFHLKTGSGKIRIEFRKSENSDDSYERIKKMCEGIKKVLTES